MAQVCPLSYRDMMTGHLHFVQDRVQSRMVQLAKRLQIGGGGVMQYLTMMHPAGLQNCIRKVAYPHRCAKSFALFFRKYLRKHFQKYSRNF